MARIILPKRPDPVRVRAARVAAARVQAASVQKSVEVQIQTIDAEVPENLEATLADFETRLSAIEP